MLKDKILLKSKNFKYFIKINRNFFNNDKKLFSIINNKKVILIISNKVSFIYLNKIISLIKPKVKKFFYFCFEDKEVNKSFKTVSKILKFLFINNCNKSTIILSIGGGVVGDITGFVSSIYKRGLKYINIPTTLVSQIDSSIGGKNAINYKYYKNALGTFHQPKYVSVCIDFLFSLSKRQFISGLSEAIKYGIIFNKKFFNWIELNVKKILNLDLNTLYYFVYMCCKMKSYIVSLDEKDKNLRLLLNLGHTYGHAIESYYKYKNVLHGEAVSIGIVMSAYSSYFLKIIDIYEVIRIERLFKKIGLPTRISKKVSVIKLLKYIKLDKKNFFNFIRLIIPVRIGFSKIINNVPERVIKKSIEICQINF
ncbi:MAG: 3-dehydroquinate synthase [Enterobacteriaceae bacterium]